MLDLDFSIVAPNIPILMEGLWVTARITLTAIVFGILIGTVLAVARSSPFLIFRVISRFYVNTFRSIPLVMVLLWFYLIVPQFLAKGMEVLPQFLLDIMRITPQTDIRFASALFAFALFEAAYYSEIIRAGINSISQGQSQAALALGMTRGQSLRLIILPQAFKVMTPLLLTQAIILFQDTALVYIIGLKDFFRTGTNIGKTYGNEIEMVLFTGLIYFIICSCMSLMVFYFKSRNKNA
jgi:amine acid ABC transporter, permease protein, 3-TM region, His/Glu/Gln/Arg/opine family